jgi:transposase
MTQAGFAIALTQRGINACIPSKSNRKMPLEHDRTLYRQRHKIENMFGRLKDWRRIYTATTDAPTPSCQPCAQPPSSSDCDQ